MAEGSDGEDKKHAPSERRLRQAAERGDVARSTDLPKAAAIVLVTTIGLNAAASATERFETVCATALALAGSGDISLASVSSQSFVSGTAPLLVLIGVLSALVGILFGGWTFSVSSLIPDFSKLSPSHGLGQLFSVSGITDTLKSLAKFVVIGSVGGFMILSDRDAFAALGRPIDPPSVRWSLSVYIFSQPFASPSSVSRVSTSGCRSGCIGGGTACPTRNCAMR